MRNIMMSLQYDGSEFYGFQRQNNVRTAQGELEKALSCFLNEKIELVAAGRTDRGVHARKQVINFYTESNIPAYGIMCAVNKRLCDEIHIMEAAEMPQDFSARFSAKSRKYEYILKNRKNYSVTDRKYVTYIKHDIDIERFMEIARPLIGKHDFDSFRKSDCTSHMAIREITDMWMEQNGSEWRLFVAGDGFLKSMIRIIVGSVLAVYTGEREKDYILNKLAIPDRFAPKILAPPNGLYLYDIEY